MFIKKSAALLLLPAAIALFLLFSVMALAVPEWNESAVVNNTFDQVNPSISGSRAVWQDYRNSSFSCPSAQNCLAADIFVEDLDTGVEQKLTATPNGLDPDISGDIAVWRDWDTGKIRMHNLSTEVQGNASTATGTIQQVNPAVSGNIIVWADFRNSTDYGDIYMRDLNAPADQPVALGIAGLANPQKDKRNPDVDGNIVVWEDWRNAYQDASGWWHNPDIYAKNISTGEVYAVCTNTDDQYSPSVSGNTVYWQDYRNGNWDVYSKDLTTGVETRMTNSPAHQSWPTASGDFLVWKDTRNGDEDIYLRRLSTGVEEMVNTDGSLPSAAQKLPVISGTRLVWMDKRDGNWDIYSADDTLAPQVTGLSPAGTLTATATTISASISEGGTGVDTASASVTLDSAPLSGCAVSETSIDCPVTGLTEGPHVFDFSVSDAAGNAGSAGGSFSVDTAGPQISNIAPSGWAGASPDISADYSDAVSGVDTASVQVSVDGVPLAGCSAGAASVSCSSSGLADGPHEIAVSAADTAGNPGNASGSFSVDSTGPQVTAGVPQGTVSSRTALIDASYTDGAGSGIDTASAVVTLDGDPLSCTVAAAGVECNATGLADGAHTVNVSVSDNLGNPGSAEWSFVVDITAPSVSNIQPAPGAAVNNPKTAVSLDYAATSLPIDDASIRMYLDDVDVTGAAEIADGSAAYQPPAPLSNGVHGARFVVADVEGNTNDTSWSFTVTSPSMSLAMVNTYWASFEDYTERRLSVDYRLSVPGDGVARDVQMAVAYATNGVMAASPLPVAFGDIPGHAYVDYTLKYYVPAGVAKFRAFSHASCTDDGGNLYWFAGPPPEGPSA